MRLIIEPSVCVITPTIGEKNLLQAYESVAEQTYKNIEHLVVIDGPEYAVARSKLPRKAHIAVNPQNTGASGFWGHRIYAAYPHLVNQDYIAFLDADNWWDSNHIESLMDTIRTNNYDWAYSLRKVYVGDQFLDNDCCESIGRWPIYFTADTENKQHLVDTSAYIFRREFLINVSQHWHSGWGGDRRFFQILTQHLRHDNYGTSGLHTLNYRLPDMKKAYGGDMEFFKRGNEIVEQRYGGTYPWTTKKI
jgi:glycosyltransferase involved in cell wall biosynthesis